jgi:hypothetical protein
MLEESVPGWLINKVLLRACLPCASLLLPFCSLPASRLHCFTDHCPDTCCGHYCKHRLLFIRASMPVPVHPAGRLSQEEIERMVKESEEFADQDKKVKARIDARNQLESYCYNMKQTVSGELLRPAVPLSSPSPFWRYACLCAPLLEDMRLAPLPY